LFECLYIYKNMEKFHQFYRRRFFEDSILFDESFAKSDIMDYKPENAIWQPPLNKNAAIYRYHFSLPSDPEKTDSYDNLPPYVLIIDGVNDAMNISFKHIETGYSDRFSFNKELSLQSGGNPGKEMMMSILHGISEYIDVKNPEMITWTPIEKTTYDAPNPDARSKVYRLWAIKNIMGRYVPIGQDKWVRMDHYEDEYVKNGYPVFDPKKYIGSKGEESFIEEIRKYLEKINRKKIETAMVSRRANAQSVLDNIELNPNRVKFDDFVYIGTEDYKKATIVLVNYNGKARLKYTDESGNRVEPEYVEDYDTTADLKDIHPVTDRTTNLRDNYLQQISQNEIERFSNNTGIKVGSKVITVNSPGVVNNIKYSFERREVFLVVIDSNGQKHNYYRWQVALED
jgi:hypothetical protein